MHQLQSKITLVLQDLRRSVTGYGWTPDFNRYSSSALQFFLINMNLKLVDLSPYTQILALLFTTLSSFILIYLFTAPNQKPSPLIVIAPTFLGLCPYTISSTPSTICVVLK